jgi:hypothetical protein
MTFREYTVIGTSISITTRRRTFRAFAGKVLEVAAWDASHRAAGAIDCGGAYAVKGDTSSTCAISARPCAIEVNSPPSMIQPIEVGQRPAGWRAGGYGPLDNAGQATRAARQSS